MQSIVMRMVSCGSLTSQRHQNNVWKFSKDGIPKEDALFVLFLAFFLHPLDCWIWSCRIFSPDPTHSFSCDDLTRQRRRRRRHTTTKGSLSYKLLWNCVHHHQLPKSKIGKSCCWKAVFGTINQGKATGSYKFQLLPDLHHCLVFRTVTIYITFVLFENLSCTFSVISIIYCYFFVFLNK